MHKLKEAIIIFSALLMLIQSVSAISNVQHSVDGNRVTLTYQGTPPYWVNIRPDTNIGQSGGYLWAKTYSNSFSYDMSFVINPSKKFYYGVKDNSWSSTNSFNIGENLCKENQYRMAFILIENSNNLATQNDIEKINILKTKASETFLWATKGLASLDTKDEVFILRMEGNPSPQEIAKKFYENYGDVYDFLTIFNTYDNAGSQYHILVKNQVQGIGPSIFDNADSYGSNRKLKGINWMKDIDMYNVDNDLSVLGVNGILHETSHQWGAYVDFIDENGQRSNSLRNPYNMAHWDKKLETGYDLLNGFSWEDNGDGTFTAKTVTDWKHGYSPLDLYLMGLLSKEKVSPLKLIISTSDTKYIQPGTTISGSIRTISMQQIIDAEGSRTCISE